MPSNPYVYEMKAIKWIDNILMKQLKEIPEGMHINELILQAKLLYPISKNFIVTWIKESYIELGYVEQKGDLLFNRNK